MKIEDYQTKIPYPNRSDFTKVFAYKAGKVIFRGTYAEYLIQKGNVVGAVLEKHVDEEAYKEALRIRNADSIRLPALLKNDLIEQNGLKGNPKAEMLFEKAQILHDDYDCGLIEIFEELADLIK